MEVIGIVSIYGFFAENFMDELYKKTYRTCIRVGEFASL
jgi:hypothetical protein